MIEFRVYKKGGKGKQICCRGSKKNMTSFAIHKKILENPDEDFIFIDVNNGRVDITYERLLSTIKILEKQEAKLNAEVERKIHGKVNYIDCKSLICFNDPCDCPQPSEQLSEREQHISKDIHE